MSGLRLVCRSALSLAVKKRSLSALAMHPLMTNMGALHYHRYKENVGLINDQKTISSTTVKFADHQIFTIKTVEDRIMLVLGLYDKIDGNKLTMDSDFFKDLGLDSLDFVEVILALEDEFRMEIPEGDSDKFKTPRDILQYLCDKQDIYE